ncbi:DNA-binding YbaB/EbfC family protein [Marmoricola sp. OAE513]|uniref:YbaB/EbfC family nucleoid-associated protein n=1 Tax=Marmoricola sp. OAE513 TaxID=2817894 RepID=UPI001AE89E4C
MTENPFGNLDLGAMLEQAQQMQAQLMAAQADLAATTFTGTAGGVTVNVTGTGDLTGVVIAPGAFDASDAESLTDLGDLVVAAFRDAKAKTEAAAAEAMGPLAGGLGGLGGELGGPTPGPLGFGPAGS